MSVAGKSRSCWLFSWTALSFFFSPSTWPTVSFSVFSTFLESLALSDWAGAGCSGATLLSPFALLSGVFAFGVVVSLTLPLLSCADGVVGVVGADGAGAFPPSFCSAAGACGSDAGVSGSGSDAGASSESLILFNILKN